MKLKYLFKPDVFNRKPKDCNNDDDFIDIVTDEMWNLDEWTPEGIIMMKRFIFKMITKNIPKKYSIDREFFRELIKKEWDNIK